jgi:hypothetical protein
LSPDTGLSREERDSVYRELVRTRSRIDGMRRVGGPGLYAVFLDPAVTLPGVTPAEDGLLYVGGTDSLEEQLLDTHFKTGKSGLSTLRRMLGAVLKQELELVAIPRGNSVKDKDPALFKFKQEGALSQWMARSLRVAAAVGSDLQDEETRFVADYHPPLNLEGWKNPVSARVVALLEACRDEAATTMKA